MPKLNSEIKALEKQIDAMQKRHAKEIDPLTQKLSELRIQELKISQGIEIGTIVEFRGKKYKINRFSTRYSSAYAYGIQFKNDGTLGIREQQFWGFEPLKVIQK